MFVPTVVDRRVGSSHLKKRISVCWTIGLFDLGRVFASSLILIIWTWNPRSSQKESELFVWFKELWKRKRNLRECRMEVFMKLWFYLPFKSSYLHESVHFWIQHLNHMESIWKSALLTWFQYKSSLSFSLLRLLSKV